MNEYTANKQLAESAKPQAQSTELLAMRKPVRYTNDGKPAVSFADPNDMSTWGIV